jgi:hypothetical protein
MNTEELVLRDGRFIHRQTSISETPIGDASELLAKYIPKGVTNIGYIGPVKWGDTVLQAHLLITGAKFLCYVTLPSIKVSLCYVPLFKSEFLSAYENKDKTLAKDILTKIHGWHFSGRANPVNFLERKVKLDVPWNESTFGQLIFGVDGNLPGRSSGKLTHTVQPATGQAYLGALRGGEIYPLRLTNHFDHGKVCMGSEWDMDKVRLTYLESLQHALDTYQTASNNVDLWDQSYATLWALTPDGTKPYWANTDAVWPAELGRPRDHGNPTRNNPMSVTSFLGIT